MRQNMINDWNSKKDKNISFSCTYEVNVINNDIQIINNRFGKYINKEIETKIKILNKGQKEKLVYKKKFDGKGKNIIDFIIVGKLNDMSFMLS